VGARGKLPSVNSDNFLAKGLEKGHGEVGILAKYSLEAVHRYFQYLGRLDGYEAGANRPAATGKEGQVSEHVAVLQAFHPYFVRGPVSQDHLCSAFQEAQNLIATISDAAYGFSGAEVS
jgi:hypothetical protein